MYFHGVAANIARERWRAKDDALPLESLPRARTPAVRPFEAQHQHSVTAESERRMGCLHDCLDRLTPISLELLTAYHLGGSGIHIGRRKQLAKRLNIPAAALRLRVYRIRRQMERCLARCLSNRNIETFPELRH